MPREDNGNATPAMKPLAESMRATYQSVHELRPEFLGIQALNPFADTNSGARAVMFGGHWSQRIILNKSMPNRIQAGPEQELGKYTFAVTMPKSGRIIKTIRRYPPGVDRDSLPYNPETLVLYEDEETHQIDCFTVPKYLSYHQTFGYRLVETEHINKLRPGVYVPGGTIFAHSPGLGENNNYMYGVMFETAYMSLPATAEDGFIISRSALLKLSHCTYETRRVSFGSNQFILNTHGTVDIYKGFPDIGDAIREDGLLLVTREYDSDLVPVEMSIYSTMTPDFQFDRPLYTKGGKGRIVDIQVICGNNPNQEMPEAMASQLRRYQKAKLRYHRELIDSDRQMRSEYRRKFGNNRLNISRKLQQALVDSYAITNQPHPSEKNQQALNLLYRKEPVDEYMIEFTIEYESVPDVAYKLTDINGGKGVIVEVWDDERMPMDAAGNRAEVIIAPEARLNRMNLAGLYAHFHGAAARDISAELRREMGLTERCNIEMVELVDESIFNRSYQKLLHYYRLVSPLQHEEAESYTREERVEHMHNIMVDGIYPVIPINNPGIDKVQSVRDVNNNFNLVYGPVTYIGNSGERCITESNVRIGPMYYMLLDKNAMDWSATTSARLQLFGVLTPMTKSEKFSRPYRDNPTRTVSEPDGRLYAFYGGLHMTAELMDRSNNPAVQKNICWNILTAERPGDIKVLVDRSHYKYGQARNIQNVRHMLHVTGITVSYKSERELKNAKV